MHLLDFVMYFVCSGLLWWIMDLVSAGELTNELGGLIGMFFWVIFTIAYIILFAIYPDWNWVDFFTVETIEWFKSWVKL